MQAAASQDVMQWRSEQWRAASILTKRAAIDKL